MEQTFLSETGAEHFTDEQAFRVKWPELAAMVDSQLPRRGLGSENCTFDYAHKGRLRNSLGQVCTFQARFKLRDNPKSAALIEVIEVPGVTAPSEKTTFRYEREFNGA
jgi:hypothetical protein